MQVESSPCAAANRDEPFYQPPGTTPYNIQLAGGVLWNRITARYCEGICPEQIDWVWMVEANRRATPAEIKQLCTRKDGEVIPPGSHLLVRILRG